MKLNNLIEYLVNPEKLEDLYKNENLSTGSEALLIYMREELNLDSEIKFFAVEETEDDLIYEKNGVQYIQLFPIDYAIELIESDLDLKGKE
jgi:hypothetical protein